MDKPQNEQDTKVLFKMCAIHWTHFLVILLHWNKKNVYGNDKPQNEQNKKIK